jgi:hypothetical protein
VYSLQRFPKHDIPRFPKFVERIRNCKGEIVLDGPDHEKQAVSSDFHTRSRTIAEMEIHAVLLNSDISVISVHLKEVTQSENTRGYRLAWSRIPSQHWVRYRPGALAVVGSNPTGPNMYMGSNIGTGYYTSKAVIRKWRLQ